MNLQLIKDFFTCIGNVEELKNQKIQSFRSMFPRINMFSLFKQLSSSSTAHINAIHMKKYLSQFSHNLQIINPNEINNLTSSKNFASTKRLSNDQVLEKGIAMFLNEWGNNQKQFTFSEFSKFFIGQQISPQQPQQVPYHARKKLFQIIETEIQGLLNIETLRQVCVKQYKNLTDLFETIASKQTHQISIKSLKNLYLMHGQRMNQQFYEGIQKRLELPINFQKFMFLLKKQQSDKNPKLQQRKVYYSSIRRKKNIDQQQQQQGDYFDEYSQKNEDDDKLSRFSNSRRSIRFQTPKTQKGNIQNRGITSTKLTKGEKITTQLKQPSVTVGRFKSQQTPQRFYTKASVVRQEIQVLGQILNYEQQFIKLKRNLCLRRDMDLQLAYQRIGQKFSELLNELYGCCNFSSFVRFIIPKDFQYKYLAYVRHQMSNKLSQETLMLFEQLLQAYERKQQQIHELWSKVDRQMIFRMYCNPGQQGINVQELGRYFSDRQCKVIVERMDPLGLGMIEYERFW